MKTKRKTAKSANVTEGSGNVFADLGLHNADQELMKARLTLQIYRIITVRGITQTEGRQFKSASRNQIFFQHLPETLQPSEFVVFIAKDIENSSPTPSSTPVRWQMISGLAARNQPSVFEIPLLQNLLIHKGLLAVSRNLSSVLGRKSLFHASG
jgi:hypothetical protein